MFGLTPILAISPDGRVQLVFYEGPSWVATSLAPSEDLWAPLVTLADTYYREDAILVAGNGVAYAALPTDAGFKLAVYDAQGWHASALLSSSGSFAGLAFNSGQAIVSWTEPGQDPSQPPTQWIQRLTGNSEKFAVPRPYCEVAVMQDATVFAACGVQGDAVPGCFDLTRGGPVQAFNRYIEAYQRPKSATDWLPPVVVSDRERRVIVDSLHSLRLLANGKGHGFLLWFSETPCQQNSRQFLTRERSPVWSFWQPQEILTSGQNFSIADVQLDRRGWLRALLWESVTDFSQTPPNISRLYAVERPVDDSGLF